MMRGAIGSTSILRRKREMRTSMLRSMGDRLQWPTSCSRVRIWWGRSRKVRSTCTSATPSKCSVPSSERKVLAEQSGDQFARLEGFGDVVVTAQLQPHDAVGRVTAPAEDQQATVALLTDLAHQVDAVHVGQAQVGDAQIGPAHRQTAQGAGAGMEALHLETKLDQHRLNQARDRQLVLH